MGRCYYYKLSIAGFADQICRDSRDLHIQVAMSEQNVSTVAGHCNLGDRHRDSVNSRICNSPGAIVGTLLRHERSLSGPSMTTVFMSQECHILRTSDVRNPRITPIYHNFIDYTQIY